MARRYFRDADLSVQDFFTEMEKILPNITSPVDLLNTSAGPSFIYNMPDNIGSPAEMPSGPDDVAVDQEHRDSLDSHPSSGDANGTTTSGTNTTESSRGFEDVEGLTTIYMDVLYPTPEVDVEVSIDLTPTDAPSTSRKKLDASVPYIHVTLPDPQFDPDNYPYYSVIGKVLVKPFFETRRGHLSTLEAALRHTIRAIYKTELEAAKKIIAGLGAEVSNLRQLNEDHEWYWEDHLKNAIKMDNLSNQRLVEVEANLRKQKRNNGQTTPDPEDFLPRTYYESVLSHLRKAYALVAIRWSRSSEKINSQRDYVDRLSSALQQVVSDFIELGGTFNPKTQWLDGCDAMKDMSVSPIAEAKKKIYEDDALFYGLGCAGDDDGGICVLGDEQGGAGLLRSWGGFGDEELKVCVDGVAAGGIFLALR
ncbi:OLC1v1001684C1 [Oldenlandia corymbosa var. corymbosa]|uniref:OLC1v1001684C1 n=1 Tax=Oldenlandia corymbosa var. corymbosa TaxID=529605 RepID=A0AAV1D635_OLDCO|nr:OLC1v1001684C1 [Oldenlandia corymbosa var. corymbosa]